MTKGTELNFRKGTTMAEVFNVPSLETGIYQHYKGNKYNVLGVGRHTEIDEYFVVYSAVDHKPDTPLIWLRPYEMFMETVEVDGKIIPRFRRIKE